MLCPICQTELDSNRLPETRPFCSPRCKRADLANWLEGNYRLPRELTPDEVDDLPKEDREKLFEELLKRS